MLKYVTNFFSNRMTVVFLFWGFSNFEKIPDFYFLVAISFFTGFLFLQNTIKYFYIFTNNDKLNDDLKESIKLNNIKQHSLYFKIFTILMLFIPSIINIFYSYHFHSLNNIFLTIFIIWCILLLESIVFYFIIKKKKEFILKTIGDY